MQNRIAILITSAGGAIGAVTDTVNNVVHNTMMLESSAEWPIIKNAVIGATVGYFVKFLWDLLLKRKRNLV